MIRTLHDKPQGDERMLLSLARSKTITWARIATALELSGRQSAERRVPPGTARSLGPPQG
ncbi:hypothetical protein [Streptomyces sp. NPDC059928]|uniref:hypothetical protein n=1 Tax=Streptomyces sp. NPDC059928 TaxID=3347007 RepID=UPI00365F0E60